MIKLITTLVIALFTLLSIAQTTTTTNSSLFSMSVNTDDDNGHNTSISVSNSDDSLRLKAHFDKSKTNKVKEMLLKRLGKKGLKIKGNTFQWTNGNNEDEFECKLSNGKLFIIVDKQAVSNHFFKEIDTLVNDVQTVIYGNNRQERDSERINRNIKRAERDLERAQRDLERAKRDLERATR